MRGSICSINQDNFQIEVVNANKPVLLLCMAKNEEFQKMKTLMEDIANKHRGELKVGLIEEKFITTFNAHYKVIGTPTFLILVAGKENKRLLGLVDEEKLNKFISDF